MEDPLAFGGVAFPARTPAQVLVDRVSREVIKVEMDDFAKSMSILLPSSDLVLLCVSPLGRFVVLQDARGHSPCILCDFEKKTSTTLLESENIQKPFASHIRFSSEEQYLIGISTPRQSNSQTVFILWTCLSGAPKFFKSRGLEDVRGLFLDSMNEAAYLATSEKWIEVDLTRRELRMDPYRSRGICKQQLSAQGDLLAILSAHVEDEAQELYVMLYCDFQLFPC